MKNNRKLSNFFLQYYAVSKVYNFDNGFILYGDYYRCVSGLSTKEKKYSPHTVSILNDIILPDVQYIHLIKRI
jgi:hypothetical protein